MNDFYPYYWMCLVISILLGGVCFDSGHEPLGIAFAVLSLIFGSAVCSIGFQRMIEQGDKKYR